MIVPRERLHAVVLAGAAGDAMGGPFEGSAPDPARALPAPPWRTSDDTRLTFATCRAIAKAGEVDPETITAELLAEYRLGLPGVGSSTLKALRDLAAGQHWALAGARGEFAAGNGAAMRIAPLAFFGDVRDPSFARSVRYVASITHRNDEAIAAALAIVWALQLAAEGSPRILEVLVDELPDTALSDSLRALAPVTSPLAAAATLGASGRAAESVALALFIGTTSPTIEDAILAAVRCGGDADTIAALAAQIRAATGEEPPRAWREHLPAGDAERLAQSLEKKRKWRFF